MADSTSIVPVTQAKMCLKCRIEKQASEFSKQSKRTDGLQSWCKQCTREYNLERYERTKTEQNARSREWAKNNKERHLATRRAWYEKNKLRLSEKQKEQWHKDSKAVERQRRYREKNRDKINANYREYYAANRGKLLAERKEYNTRKPEIMRNAKVRRRAIERAPDAPRPSDLLTLIAGQTDKRGRLRCWHCGCVCTDKYEIDHFVPVSKGGSNAIGNLRISCKPCNRHKSARMPWDFNGRLL